MSRLSRIKQNQFGFTLLEVMIAVAIMAGLSLLTAQTMRSSIDNQRFVTSEINRDSQLADTMRIMRSDISQAFHYQDLFCKMMTDAAKTPNPTTPPNPPNPPNPPSPPAPPADPTGEGAAANCNPNYTGFIGKTDSLYFTALANMRVIKDSQESDQMKVGYFLKTCRSMGVKAQGSSECLYRSTSPRLDENLDTPDNEVMLLDNVQEFKLRYLGPGNSGGDQEMTENWRTWKDSPDANQKANFPYAVEISLTIQNKNDPKDRPSTQTVLAPLFFPNNPSKKKDDGTKK